MGCSATASRASSQLICQGPGAWWGGEEVAARRQDQDGSGTRKGGERPGTASGVQVHSPLASDQDCPLDAGPKESTYGCRQGLFIATVILAACIGLLFAAFSEKPPGLREPGSRSRSRGLLLPIRSRI